MADGGVGLDGQRPLPIGIVTWAPERVTGERPTQGRDRARRQAVGRTRRIGRPGAPGSSPTMRPSRGVHLVTWRRATGQPAVPYADAVEEALCVGWVDSKAGEAR